MGPKHITVLGGGVTGLVAAYRLSEHLPSTQIVLVEACHRLGGWVHSERRAVEFVRDGRQASGEVILEGGPRSIRPRGGPGAARMLKLVSP
jgi:oxygen-dependent protoporphyrinogen oxidase